METTLGAMVDVIVACALSGIVALPYEPLGTMLVAIGRRE